MENRERKQWYTEKKGYHLEHNFDHNKKRLSSLLRTFNLLAFLFHTFFNTQPTGVWTMSL